MRLKLLDDGICDTKVSCDGLRQERWVLAVVSEDRQELSADLALAVELEEDFVLSHILSNLPNPQRGVDCVEQGDLAKKGLNRHSTAPSASRR